MTNKLTIFLACLLMTLPLHAQQTDNYRSLLVDKSVKITDTNLPIVFINTSHQMIRRDSRILAKMKIIWNGENALTHGDTIAYPNQTVDYEGYIGLKYRGNSSFNQSDKKPFAIQTLASGKLSEDGGEKQKVKILGMGKDNKWATIAPWSDRSMIRDILAFELGRPWFDYVPSGRYCELIMDGTYYGIHIFCERISKGKKRLDLHDPEEDGEGAKGDYLLQIDRNDDPYFTSIYAPWSSLSGGEERWKTIKYQYQHPEEEDFAELPVGSRENVIDDLTEMESSFMDNNYKDPVSGYRHYIDQTSFIDYLLATELAFNIDGYRLSTYYYKYCDDHAAAEGLDNRWKMSLWDFNIAYGNANYYDGSSTTLWQYLFNARQGGDAEHVPFYWYRMLSDETFVTEMKNRWREYRNGSYSNEAITAKIDSIANMLTSGGAIDRNQKAWQIIGKWGVWPCPNNPSTYEEEVRNLKSWITKRLKFMDKQLLTPVVDEKKEHITVSISDGFNQDVIAEDMPVGNYTSSGIDSGGYVFYSTDVRSDGGLQSNDIVSPKTNIKYSLADFATNNALRLEGNTRGTLISEESFFATSLSILATSANGVSTVKVQVNYTDGTYSDSNIEIKDWSVRNPTGEEAQTGLGRCNRQNDTFSADPHYALFEAEVEVNSRKSIESVTFTNNGNAIPSILAISYAKGEEWAMLTPDEDDSGVYGSEDFTHLFDQNIYTKYGFNFEGQPVHIIFHADKPVCVSKYYITTANDNATYAGRNPGAWVLYGSTATRQPKATSTSWEVIDEVEQDATLEDVNYTEFEFPVKSNKEYRYFMLTINGRSGGYSTDKWHDNYIQMAELGMKTRQPDCETDDIDSAMSDNQPHFIQDGDDIAIVNLKPGQRARIYIIGGTMIETAEASSLGVTTLTLRHLPSGVYIISAGGVSKKIRK